MDSEKYFYNTATAFVFLVLCILIAMTVKDYGLSWDEPIRRIGGQIKLSIYEELIKGGGGEVIEAYGEDYYPGLYDITLALLDKVSPIHALYTGHLWSCLFGLLGILGAWRIAYLLGSAKSGFWAVLFLATIPGYYGHMYINPKDIPFAACYIWAIYALMKFAESFPRFPVFSTLRLGIAIGLALAVRLGGVILMAYVGLTLILYGMIHVTQDNGKGAIRIFFKFTGIFSFILIIAFLTLLPWWPYALLNPMSAFFSGFEVMHAFPFRMLTLFMGTYYPAPELPWYYILVWLFISTPEIILLLLFIGLIPLTLWLFNVFKSSEIRYGLLKAPSQMLQYFILILSAIFPLFYVILKDVTLYDGMRHLIFIIPPFASLAALIFSWFLKKMQASGLKILFVGLQSLVIVLLAFNIKTMFNLHPYEYVFFNPTFGGLQAAHERYETEYWATSYREAVAFLKVYLALNDEDIQRPYKIWVAPSALSAKMFFENQWNLMGNPENADFHIATTRLKSHEAFDGKVIAVVERYNVPFSVVKDCRKLAIAQNTELEK